MPRIAVDLDGVLADTIVPCCRIINSAHGTNFEVSSFNQWNAWEVAHIPKDEFLRSLDSAWHDWRTIPPTEENLEHKVARLLPLAGVDIVTGRSPETVTSAKSWLRFHRIEYNSFVRTNSTLDKAKLSYEVFIDDSPELMYALSATPGRHGILYTQPWNKQLPELPGIYRADSWNQILESLERIFNRMNVDDS